MDSTHPCAESPAFEDANQLTFQFWRRVVASAKSVLERMIAAMNRGDAAGLRKKDIDVFAKPAAQEKARAEEEPCTFAQKSKF
jgi:hypothetical protein